MFPYEIIDLTHTLNPNIPTWNGGCGFKSEIKLDYENCSEEVKFRVQQLKMHAGIGTHIDAPAHCVPNGLTVEQLPLSNLLAPAVIIDVSGLADEYYSVTVHDIEQFEKTYGLIQPNTCVLIKTGWERFWNDPLQYRNNLLFPAVSREATQLLLKRKIVGLGIDTLSPDRPGEGYPVHELLLGSGKFIIENVANLDVLPHKGAYVLVLPLKIEDATEAPIRLVGLINKS